MTQKQLEDYLWGAANILRGMIDAADFNNTFFLCSFSRGFGYMGGRVSEALELSDGDMTMPNSVKTIVSDS
jgi:type I restriction enzyme M protein